MSTSISESQMNNLRYVQLELLKKLDEICCEHHLQYYIAYGTCLGAVRHGGFIPWDHDVDVLMPIDDVKTLIELQKGGKLGERYFLQSKETSSGFGSIACALCDSNTTYISNAYKKRNMNHGIYMDIYPYYDCPNSNIKLLFNIWKSHLYRILVSGERIQNHGKIARLLSIIILTIYKGEYRQRKIEKLEKCLCDEKNGKKILDYFGRDISLFSAITYPKEWFNTPQKLKFEGHWFNAPTEPEKYLTRRYGDYMKLPPSEERFSSFDNIIIDTNKSYKEYMHLL